MAIARVREIASVGGVTGASTFVAALSGMVGGPTVVNEYLVARVAVDNSGGGGAAPGRTVTDTGSNTWTVTTAALQDPGVASAGATCYIAYSKVVTPLTTADSITFTWGSGSPAAKAVAIDSWSGIDYITNPIAVANVRANGLTGTPSVTIVPTATGQLVYGALAIEGLISDTYTEDTDTTNGSWVTLTASTSGGASFDVAQTIRGAYKLVTASGSQTWDPAITARDWAQSTIVFAVAPPVPPSPPPRLGSRIAVRRSAAY